MNSAIYEGTVRHRRFAPVEHVFQYRVFYAYLDLSELPQVLDGLPGWSARRAAFARFAREDHFGEPDIPLDHAVRDLVEARLGVRPDGAIHLLTLPRTLGVVFNPISIYYCHRADGTLCHLVTEVDNTPWGERHCYVVDADRDNLGTARALRFRVSKAFHVSPFHSLDQEYEWRFTRPARSLVVHMENWEAATLKTDATLTLRRQPLDPRHATLALIRHPAMALSVLGGIYVQAAKLWRKGVPYHPHPKKLATTTRGATS
jgi:DUF1365 family protein